MNSNLLPLALALLTTAVVFSQKEENFGKLTLQEKNFNSYNKDPDAGAVVLYERGDNYFEVIDRRIWLVKDFHGKIKILNEKGFDAGTISIPIYKGESSSEKVKDIRAITHNGSLRRNSISYINKGSGLFDSDVMWG
jgi:hypothetical protein